MRPARGKTRAALSLGMALTTCAIVAAPPVWPQINPPQPGPMEQDPATGLIPLAPPPIRSRDRGPIVTAAPGGAALRALDKMSGQVSDQVLAPGGSVRVGSLTVSLQECRYPVDDPASNAYAYLTIRDDGAADPLFRGWMIANSPALNALDHPRYDIWVQHCAMTESAEGSAR